MARSPKQIPKKAREAWEAGDEPTAERLSGLRSRQLRNRLGAPGQGAAKPAAASQAPTAAPAPQKLVRVAPRATAATPEPPEPPPSEPTAEEIGALDTEAEAQRVYRLVSAKIATADDVRFASLSEKALAALNRIEQIRARRPQVQAPDEVTRRLVEVRGRAVERFGIAARAAVERGAGA